MAAGKVQPRHQGYQSDVGCTSEAVCRVCYLIVLRTAAEAQELFLYVCSLLLTLQNCHKLF